ncbi:replicative DNA helicase [Pleomorphochaeta sp. DL1XJH-081]|uniref:replicative DNA helicase n=1 Tax=Pleomorphochaeta sp. DL1XJH-081 TaxID=3409690 RepID=UPI003BB61339
MASYLSAGRIPPHNDDAERAVLGAVLLSSTAFSEVSEVLRKDDFYKPGHQVLFDAILAFHQEHSSQTIDLITITDYLRSKNLLDLTGGMAYVASLTSDVPTTSNAVYYANIVRSHSLRRALLELSGKLQEEIFDESQEIANVLDESERKLSDLQASSGTFTEKYQESSILVNKTVDRLMERAKHGNIDGVKTGFIQLDEMTGGFQPAEFIVIGARPSVGKTAFAISMAVDIAIKRKIPTGFFSAEMTSMAIMERILAAEARVDSKRIRSAILRSQDMVNIVDAASRIYEGKLYIQDTPNIKLLDLRSQARRMKREKDIKILFIDYISLINPESKANVPRHEQVAEISRSLKSLSRELQIPIVALSQVSRDAEGKEPNLANLRESGSVEQDADVVILLHRDRLADLSGNDKEGRNGNSNQQAPQTIQGFPVQETKVILAKQRNGETGVITMGFQNQLVRFVDIERSSGSY